MKLETLALQTSLGPRIHCPSVADRPKPTIPEQYSPSSRRSLQDIGHVENLAIGEDSQIVPGLATSSVGARDKLKHVNGMRREDIGKASASHVFVRVGDCSTNGQISMFRRHPGGQQGGDPLGVAFGTNRPSDMFGCGPEVLRRTPGHPVPKPVSDVPSSNSPVNGAKGPELRLTINQTGPLKFLRLKCKFGDQVLPRAKVKRLTSVRDVGRESHKSYRGRGMSSQMLPLSASSGVGSPNLTTQAQAPRVAD